MITRGRIAIVLIVLVALGSAIYAVWYRHEQGRRALHFWGVETSVAINHALHVDLLQLSRQDDGQGRQGDSLNLNAAEHLTINGHELRVLARYDISKSGGIVHARHALLQDASFDWDSSPRDDCSPDWDFAYQFHHQRRSVTIVFDLDCGLATLLEHESTREISIAPIAKGLRLFIDDKVAEAAAESQNAKPSGA